MRQVRRKPQNPWTEIVTTETNFINAERTTVCTNWASLRKPLRAPRYRSSTQLPEYRDRTYFAVGAIATAGTYVFYECYSIQHMPYGIAVVFGLASAAVLSVLIQLGIMRRLRQATELLRVIATIGVMLVIQQTLGLLFPQQQAIFVPSKLPTTAWHIFGGGIGWDKTDILIIVIVLVVILSLVYRNTRFGRATSAIAENPRAAAGLGYSPDVTSAINWAVGGILAAGAGILLVPITGLQVDEYTLLVVPTIAAAMFGSLNSFALALVGGLVIGVVESELTRYASSVTGLTDAVPFMIIILLTLKRGRSLPQRGDTSAKLPSVGAGTIRPLLLVVLVGFTLLIVETLLSDNWLDAVIIWAVTALLLLSFVVIIGYAGQISLAQLTFAGLGAYFSGRLVSSAHWSFLPAMIVGIVATAGIGIVVGILSLRIRSINLAIVTLGFAVAVNSILFQSASLTGGLAGTVVGSPSIAGIDVDATNHPGRYAFVCIVVLLLVGIAVANLRRGRVGRRLLAARVNERAAAGLGVSVNGAKLYAFALGAAIAAASGVLLAFRNTTILYSSGFDAITSASYLASAVVGGVGWLAGPVIGGSGVTGSVGYELLNLIGSGLGRYITLISSVLLLLTILNAPDGLASLNYELGRRIAERLHLSTRFGRGSDARIEAGPLAPAADASGHTVTGPRGRFEANDVTVRFGGNTVVNGVSLSLDPGEVVGIIGPNGAGKTTFVDAASGFVNLAAGSIRLGGEDVTGLLPHRIARREWPARSSHWSCSLICPFRTICDAL